MCQHRTQALTPPLWVGASTCRALVKAVHDARPQQAWLRGHRLRRWLQSVKRLIF